MAPIESCPPASATKAKQHRCCSLPAPANDDIRGSLIDMMHFSYLAISFLDVFLADTQGVYPQYTRLGRKPQMQQSRVKILIDGQATA
jgi:hypothetical protein